MCGDVSGAVAQQNTVRHSFQRGFVIHGSHNATLIDNVAYEVAGHCFFLEDGVETGNVFDRNIGSHIRRPLFPLPRGPGQSDANPTVFWISHASNYWFNNVAAGSAASGFWFETARVVNGPSLHANPDLVPQLTLLGKFKDNIAHSCTQRGVQLYSPGWRPTVRCTLENTVVFRTRWAAFMIHNNINVTVSGGLVADAGSAVLNFRAASNIFEKFEIIGYSKNIANVRSKTESWGYCPNESIKGISLHSWNIAPYSTFGIIYRDLHFRRFAPEETGCTGGVSPAIYISTSQIVNYFDNPSRLVNVTIDHGIGHVQEFDACKAREKGLYHVFFEDVDGGLSSSFNHQPGFYVSDSALVTTFSGDCEEVPNACLKFCPNACLKQTTFMASNVPAMAPIEMTIRRTDGFDPQVTDAVVTSPWAQHQFQNSTFDVTNNRADGKFTAVLPEGEYEVEFRDKVTGAPAWPDYIEDYAEDAPFCNPDLQHRFTIVMPAFDSERCAQLIPGGGFEDISFGWGKWQQSLTELGLVSPGFGGSKHAMKVSNREHAKDFVSMYVDVSCLVPGQIYEFSAKIRMELGGEIQTCNAIDATACPTAIMSFFEWDSASKVSTNTKIKPLASIESEEQSADGFYSLYGLVRMTEDEAYSTKAQIKIANPELVDYIIDDASFKVFEPPVFDQQTETQNILSPKDVVFALGGNTLGAHHGIEKAMDGKTSKTMILTSEDSDDAPGLEVFPITSKCTVVNGMTIVGAWDRFGNDPTSYEVWGRKSLDDDWTLISKDLLALPQDRNANGADISTEGLLKKRLSFKNNEDYIFYRVVFPTTKQDTGMVHVGEVMLSGFYCPAGYVAAPFPNDPPPTRVTYDPGTLQNIAFRKPATQTSINHNGAASRAVDGNTNGIWVGESVTYSLSGSSWEVNLQSSHDVQYVVIWKRMDECCMDVLQNFAVELLDAAHNQLVVLPHLDLVPLENDHVVFDISSHLVPEAQYVAVHAWSGSVLNMAEVQVFAPVEPAFALEEQKGVDNFLSPADTLTGWGYRTEQGPHLAFDGTGAKWTVDLTIAEALSRVDIIPAISSCTVANGLRVYTNEKDVSADPTSYRVEGKALGSDGSWCLISHGPLTMPLQRNAPDAPDMSSTDAYYGFAPITNLEEYAEYRISFPTNNGGDSLQIAEIQLSGTVCVSHDYEHGPTAAPTASPTIHPDRVCHDLITTNGNAENHPMLPAPFERSYETAPWPIIMQDSSDSPDGSSQFFRLTDRSRWVDGMTIYIAANCVRNDWPYAISFQYRIHSSEPMLARVRMDYKLALTLGEEDQWENGVLDVAVRTAGVSPRELASLLVFGQHLTHFTPPPPPCFTHFNSVPKLQPVIG
jgi:hypothetical protein